MSKLILCPMLICIGCYIGFYISHRFQSRVKQLELCDLLFQRIKVYLEYEKTPTKTLINRLASSESFIELTFIKRCNEKLETNKNFPEVWKLSLDESKSELALTKEDYEPLKQLSEIIGAYDVEAQTSGITLLENIIKLSIADAVEQNKTTGKLYRSLGILAGIAAAILVI